MSTDATDSPEFEPPTEEPLGAIPGYQLLRVLGHGYKSIAYEARQDGLDRKVVVKIVRASSPKELLQLRAQAESVASVCHPNVVQIFEATEHAGKLILAVEHVPGGSLADHLRDLGRMTAKAAATLLVDVARGLAAANEQQIVHGNLKPGDILLTDQSEPKITDLGNTLQFRGSMLSRPVMGQPVYTPPELIQGAVKFVGPSVDVWALGVILYECITGRRPFAADNSHELMLSICKTHPELPSQLVPDLPRDLEAVCLKCLAKNPVERYPTAAEVADDLTRFLAGEPVSSRPKGRGERILAWVRGHKIATALSTLMVTLTVVGLVGFYVTWHKAEEQARLAKESQMQEMQQALDAAVARAQAEQVQTSERKRADDATTAQRTSDQNLLAIAGNAADLIVAVFAQSPQLPADPASHKTLLDALAACRRAAASPQTTPALRVRLSAAFVTAGALFEKQNLNAEALELQREAVELARPALTANPTDRQTVAQYVAALSHHAEVLVKVGKAAEALPLVLEAAKLTQLSMASSEGEDRRFWKSGLWQRSEAVAEVYRKLGRRTEAAQALRDAKGQIQDSSQLRLIAGDFALLAASVPTPPTADEVTEKEGYLAEAIETLRVAVESGWKLSTARTYRPSTIDNADFRPFQDHPEVKKLFAEAAKK